MQDLSPYDFDRSDSGWRLLDSQRKFLEAAIAIETYISSHIDKIKTQNQISIQTMYFHAGQAYAMAGPKYYRNAIDNFNKSYKSKIDWDIYVDGTIAFLNKDKKKLQEAADKLSGLANKDVRLQTNAQLLNDCTKALNVSDGYASVYEKATQ
jgi:ABC-type thiamine transport system substrate-binding protein